MIPDEKVELTLRGALWEDFGKTSRVRDVSVRVVVDEGHGEPYVELYVLGTGADDAPCLSLPVSVLPVLAAFGRAQARVLKREVSRG